MITNEVAEGPSTRFGRSVTRSKNDGLEFTKMEEAILTVLFTLIDMC